ncbi:MAG: hypothetical protein HGA45_41940, partial [Chloroflexales bacterium]|nr:hypothetical protein [Chloroflexales bacterium]
MRPLMRPLVTLAAVLAVGGSLSVTFAQPRERCFPETGFCLSRRVLEFWEQNGGLPVFGYPTGPQQEVVVEGQAIQAQQFERNRLELHPEAPPPYDVQLGRLGAQVLAAQSRDWASFPKSDPSAPFYFAETGQAIAPAAVIASPSPLPP